jgi:hypothetical protein
MPQIPDQSAVVAQVRARFPTPLGAQHAACLVAIATAIKQEAGLLKKDVGTFVTLPDGVRVAQDIICFPDGQHFDVLVDAEGAAQPAWQDKGFVDASRYHPVGPPPPPPPADDVLALLQTIDRKLDRLLAKFPDA